MTPAKQLWSLCREITRRRYGNTCYTCGKQNLSGSDFQTGHFIAKSICSTELAYDLDNLRIQCSACNIWKSGNWVAFEEHLIADHGREYVETLKRRNKETKGKKYGSHWMKQKIVEHKEVLSTLPPPNYEIS